MAIHTKHCNKCKTVKDEDDFYNTRDKKGNLKKFSWCKECWKKRGRDIYKETDGAYHKEYNRINHEVRREYFEKYNHEVRRGGRPSQRSLPSVVQARIAEYGSIYKWICSDPERHEAYKKQKRDYYRNRYQNDPEYRAKVLAKMKEAYHRKKNKK